MRDKLKRFALLGLWAFLAAGALGTIALFLTPEIVIGSGQMELFLQRLETFDFKWWTIGWVTSLWLFPLLLYSVYRRAQRAGVDIERLRGSFAKLLEGHSIPVIVDIDQKVPVSLDEPMNFSLHASTHIDIDDLVDIELDVPLKTELPIQTEITTKVLGIGNITIPLRAQIPIDITVPIKSKIRISAADLPITVKEITLGQMGTLEIPLRTRVEAKIDILRNLQSAQALLSKSASRKNELTTAG